MPTQQQQIDAFLAGSPFAVVGASTDREKFGNKALRAYQQAGLEVYPVNPSGGEIEGLTAYPDLASLPVKPHGVSIVTPPAVTERIVEQAGDLGVAHVWMQPGAESDEAVRRAGELGIDAITDACVLVKLRFRE